MKNFIRACIYLSILAILSFMPGRVRAATINGYTFENNSYEITNPYISMTVGSVAEFTGTIDNQEFTMRYTGEQIEEVYGVQCLRIKLTWFRGAVETASELEWYAQDTAGNVHFFKEVDDDGDFFVITQDSQIPNFKLPAHPYVGMQWEMSYHRLNDPHIVVDDAAVLGPHADCLRVLFHTNSDSDFYWYYVSGLGVVGMQFEGSTFTRVDTLEVKKSDLDNDGDVDGDDLSLFAADFGWTR